MRCAGPRTGAVWLQYDIGRKRISPLPDPHGDIVLAAHGAAAADDARRGQDARRARRVRLVLAHHLPAPAHVRDGRRLRPPEHQLRGRRRLPLARQRRLQEARPAQRGASAAHVRARGRARLVVAHGRPLGGHPARLPAHGRRARPLRPRAQHRARRGPHARRAAEAGPGAAPRRLRPDRNHVRAGRLVGAGPGPHPGAVRHVHRRARGLGRRHGARRPAAVARQHPRHPADDPERRLVDQGAALPAPPHERALPHPRLRHRLHRRARPLPRRRRQGRRVHLALLPARRRAAARRGARARGPCITKETRSKFGRISSVSRTPQRPQPGRSRCLARSLLVLLQPIEHGHVHTAQHPRPANPVRRFWLVLFLSFSLWCARKRCRAG